MMVHRHDALVLDIIVCAVGQFSSVWYIKKNKIFSVLFFLFSLKSSCHSLQPLCCTLFFLALLLLCHFWWFHVLRHLFRIDVWKKERTSGWYLIVFSPQGIGRQPLIPNATQRKPGSFICIWEGESVSVFIWKTKLKTNLYDKTTTRRKVCLILSMFLKWLKLNCLKLLCMCH